MQKLRIESFTISAGEFGAGQNQDINNPMRIGGTNLHKWVFATKTFQNIFGQGECSTGADNDFAARGFTNIGAWILGRNMFGPFRGIWPDENWKGWWGDNPPYHVPVYVLTNHPRKSFELDGGTTFHFITDGIHSALEAAFDSAGGKPVLLGSRENLFSKIDLVSLGHKYTDYVTTANATHVIIQRTTK